MRFRIRRRRPAGSLAEAEAAITAAGRGAEQAAGSRADAEEKLADERRFFGRLLADDSAPDRIAAAIEASLRRGGGP